MLTIRLLVVSPLSPYPGTLSPARLNVDPGALIDRQSLGSACLVRGRSLGITVPDRVIAMGAEDGFVHGAWAFRQGFSPSPEWPGIPRPEVDADLEGTFAEGSALAVSPENPLGYLIVGAAAEGHRTIAVCGGNIFHWLAANYGVPEDSEGPIMVEANVEEGVVKSVNVVDLAGFRAERGYRPVTVPPSRARPAAHPASTRAPLGRQSPLYQAAVLDHLPPA